MIDDILELVVDVAEVIAKKHKRKVPPAVATSEEADGNRNLSSKEDDET